MTQFQSPQHPAIGSTKLVLIALGLAVLAVVLNSLYIAAIQRRANEETFAVYTLSRSVQPGDRLRKEDVKTVWLPARFKDNFRALGAIDEPWVKTNFTTESPTQVQRGVIAGDILRFAHFKASERNNIDMNIPSGMRLVSLPVNSRTLPEALREGMYVDLEAAFPTDAAVPQVMTILEGVKVFAIGSRTVYDDNDPSRYRSQTSYHSIAILVKPADATNMAMIERLIVGDFEIQIRPPGDASTKIDADTKRKDSDINPRVLDLVEKRSGELPTPKR